MENSTEAEIRALVASGLDLFFELHESEFKNEEDPWQAKSMTEMAVQLSELREFVTCRMASIADKLRESERPRTHHFSECPRCLQDAVTILDESIICLFCGYGVTIHEAAEMLSEDQSVENCPVCHRPAIAKHQIFSGKDPTFECFCCGYFRGPEIKWTDGKGGTLIDQKIVL